MSALQDVRVNYPQIAGAIEELYCRYDIPSIHVAPLEREGLAESDNIYERSKKEPSLEGDHDFSESDLENETEKIEMEFAALVTNVLLDMESQGISPEHIAQHLKNIHGLEPVYVNSDTPLLNKRVEEVRKKATLNAVFTDVISDYYSWFNHSLIENIINTFCMKSQHVIDRLQVFRMNFSEYSKQRVSECVPSNGFGHGRGSDVKKLVLKVDKKWSIARVEQMTRIRNIVAKILKVKKHTLYLRAVENGCFQMTFIIPEFVAATIFPLQFPTEQEAALSKVGVIELHCDDYDLQLKALPNELQDSYSEVG